MIDLHSHILPGLDDGASSIDESVAIAMAAVADGIVGIAATPHVRDDYPTSVEAMRQGVAALAAVLAARRIPLEVYTGGEIALDRLRSLPPAEIRGYGLAGSRYVLLEFPYHGWPLDLPTLAFELQTAGLTPVLAHPERNGEVMAAPQRLEALVATGLVVQVTAASLDGRLGGRTQRCAVELVDRGLAHLIASDAHAPSLRGVGMTAAAETIGDKALARWLTVDVPAAIVGDEELPPAPAGRGRKRRWWSKGL